MTHLAITDHDTTAGLAEAGRACAEASIQLIPAIELSTRFEGSSVDILGYGIDPECKTLQDVLGKLIEARRARIPQMLARLQEIGIDIEPGDIARWSAGGVIGRPHIAQALVAKGVVDDVAEAFGKYIGKGRPGYVAKEVLSVEEAIGVIRAAGGIAVLAHPGFVSLPPQRFEAMLNIMVDAGLAGIEVFYSQHGADDVARYSTYAKQRRLLATGGSDFHGSAKPHIELGLGPEGKPLPTKLAFDLIQAIEMVMID